MEPWKQSALYPSTETPEIRALITSRLQTGSHADDAMRCLARISGVYAGLPESDRCAALGCSVDSRAIPTTEPRGTPEVTTIECDQSWILLRPEPLDPSFDSRSLGD